MARVYNFSAGPAVLPLEVLEQAREELVDWHGSGMSVMEMSHRGKEFVAIAAQAEADLRELLAIPANYKVLFLQGGATAQFSAVPLNLLRGKASADYVNTGAWSKKAISEAKKFCAVNVAATTEADTGSVAPVDDGSAAVVEPVATPDPHPVSDAGSRSEEESYKPPIKVLVTRPAPEPDPVEVAPRLCELAHALRAEHRQLYLQVCELLERAAAILGGKRVSDLVLEVAAGFIAFDDQFRRHESREVDLIQEEYEDDIGGGD